MQCGPPLPSRPTVRPEIPYPPIMDDDLVERARNAVTGRAELPGMSLIEHLEELRRRLIHSAIYLVVGFFVAYYFHDGIAAMMQRPITTALARLISGELPLQDWVALVRATVPPPARWRRRGSRGKLFTWRRLWQRFSTRSRA